MPIRQKLNWRVYTGDVLKRRIFLGLAAALTLRAVGLYDQQLAMADALLYADAQSRKAHFVTTDAHFQKLPDVRLLLSF